jgi:hypothetical protein
MSLAGEADDGHVAAAFDLFTKSTINAMNAGLINSSTERLEVSPTTWAANLCFSPFGWTTEAHFGVFTFARCRESADRACML